MTKDQEPAYRRVANDLRAAIMTNVLPEGTRLPVLRDLASQYGVSKGAAERALSALQTEGLIASRQGSGTFVKRFGKIRRTSPGRLAQERWGAGNAIQDHDTGSPARMVDVVVGEEPAPPFVAKALGVEPGAMVLSRSRRFAVDERPVQLATSYLPIDLIRGTPIERTDTGPGGIYARLAELGQAPAEFTELVGARAPHPDEAAQLGLPAADGRVFEITRHAYTAEGRCIEVNRMVLDARVYELAYRFSA